MWMFPLPWADVRIAVVWNTSPGVGSSRRYHPFDPAREDVVKSVTLSHPGYRLNMVLRLGGLNARFTTLNTIGGRCCSLNAPRATAPSGRALANSRSGARRSTSSALWVRSSSESIEGIVTLPASVAEMGRKGISFTRSLRVKT